MIALCIIAAWGVSAQPALPALPLADTGDGELWGGNTTAPDPTCINPEACTEASDCCDGYSCPTEEGPEPYTCYLLPDDNSAKRDLFIIVLLMMLGGGGLYATISVYLYFKDDSKECPPVEPPPKSNPVQINDSAAEAPPEHHPDYGTV